MHHARNSSKPSRSIDSVGLPIIVCVGLLAFLPALLSPLFLDDYLHAAMVSGTFPGVRQPFDLYNFIDDGNRAALFELGVLPWWADGNVTIRFFRPLASLLLWADHVVFEQHALPMHLHSMLWWGAAVLAARALYRRWLTPRVTLLATAVFALAPCHSVPLAWLANRETLVSLALGAAALGFHSTWREERRLASAALATALFTLSLFGGGEYALSFGGYVLAIEIVRRHEPITTRIAGTLPFVIPAAGYLALRSALHYGAEGSGFYADPLRDPWLFVTKFPWRATVLLGDGWLSLGAESWTEGWAKVAAVLLVAGGATILRITLRRVVARLDASTRSTAQWLLLGSLLSLLPVLAVVPSWRLLGASMLGVGAIVGLVLEHAWFVDLRAERRGVPELVSMFALGLAFAHFVHGPVISWLSSRKMRHEAVSFAALAKAFPTNGSSVTELDVGIVRGVASAYFMPFALSPGRGLPRNWTVLAQTGHVLVLRVDEHTLDLIAPPGSALVPRGEANLFRDERSTFTVGREFDHGTVRAIIRDVGEAGPRNVRFVFRENVDAMRWVTDSHEKWEPSELPSTGFGTPFDP